jgi:hypothetical protein
MWSLASVSIADLHEKIVRTNLPRSKVPLVLIALELDERREEQNHVSALVHNRTVAERTADLARQLVFGGFGGRVVPLEVVVTVFEVDVVFVENGGPLEWCGCGRVSILYINQSDLIRKNIPC